MRYTWNCLILDKSIFYYYDKIWVSGALTAHLSNQKIMFEHTAKWSLIKGIPLMKVIRSVQFSNHVLILYTDNSKNNSLVCYSIS